MVLLAYLGPSGWVSLQMEVPGDSWRSVSMGTKEKRMEQSASDRFIDSLNRQDPDGIRDALASDFVFEEVAGPGEPSIAALLEEARMLRGAFPDIDFRPVRVIKNDDRTLVEFRAIGTHRGDFLSVPATGSTAIVSGVFSLQIDGPAVSRLRLTIDFGGLRRQLLLAARSTRPA
jgi:steroid delta-isomerase-like uncharacterized protein